ncbi:hypothetical protein PS720_02115 [Pseudomonas fluorescens]|nr:hypothetical protein PS720_02115 [Pseudomonas fluorescens]
MDRIPVVDHFILAQHVGRNVVRGEERVSYGTVRVGFFFVQREVVKFLSALVHRHDADDQAPFHHATFNFVQLRGM